MNLTPYLIFDGNCAEALRFYEKALGGEIRYMIPFEGSPVESMAEEKQHVMHSQFEAGNVVFRASDSGKNGPSGSGSGIVHLSLSFDGREELEKVFGELSEQGTVTMPLQDTFWGSYFGMVTDKFGIKWMVSYDNGEAAGTQSLEIGV